MDTYNQNLKKGPIYKRFNIATTACIAVAFVHFPPALNVLMFENRSVLRFADKGGWRLTGASRSNIDTLLIDIIDLPIKLDLKKTGY